MNSSSNETFSEWTEFKYTIKQVYDAEAKWITSESFFCLITAYSVLIIFGCLGNCLVLATAIFGSSEMRSARNVFIWNLAISDLCLCIVTMPLTLVEVVYQRWHWGNTPTLCHLQSPLQTIFVVISSLSISAIALDRCIVICCININNWSTRKCLAGSIVVWLIGMIVTAPLGVYRRLLSTAESLTLTGYPFSSMVEMYVSHNEHNSTAADILVKVANSVTFNNATHEYQRIRPTINVDSRVPEIKIQELVIHSVSYLISEMQFDDKEIVNFAECIERFPSATMEKVYTSLLTTIQFLLPLVTVGIANTLIYSKLRDRLQQFNSLEMNEKRKADIQRMKRTCWLLICMVTIFLICWLPLTIFNFAINSIRMTFKEDDNMFFSLFALCHLLGMTSAWANPILYGFLNENFKKELISFTQIFKRKSLSNLRNRETEVTNI